MKALPGTILANEILKKTGTKNKLWRHFTYKRTKDRSYKMWGNFNDEDAEKIIKELNSRGAINARKSFVLFSPNRSVIRGIRFEY